MKVGKQHPNITVYKFQKFFFVHRCHFQKFQKINLTTSQKLCKKYKLD